MVLASTWCSKNPYTQRMSEIGRIVKQGGGQEAIIRASMLWLFTLTLTQANSIQPRKNRLARTTASDPLYTYISPARWACVFPSARRPSQTMRLKRPWQY